MKFSIIEIILFFQSRCNINQKHRIGGVIVSVLVSSAIDRGFEPRSDQTKEYEIGICCFSAKSFNMYLIIKTIL
jgi:hypothetical protein